MCAYYAPAPSQICFTSLSHDTKWNTVSNYTYGTLYPTTVQLKYLFVRVYLKVPTDDALLPCKLHVNRTTD